MTVVKLCTFLSEWQHIIIYRDGIGELHYDGTVNQMPVEYYFEVIRRIGVNVIKGEGPHIVVEVM